MVETVAGFLGAVGFDESGGGGVKVKDEEGVFGEGEVD